MAPKAAQKGVKRNAKAETPPVKKPKVDTKVVAVCNAISSSGLPEGCRATLMACAPLVLPTFADERHEIHEKVYRMIGETLQESKDKLQQSLVDARDKVVSLECSKGELGEQCAKNQHRVEEAAVELKVCKAKVELQKAVAKTKTDAVTAAREAQRYGDGEAHHLKADAAVLGKARELGLAAIKDDTCDAETRAAGLATLEPFWRLLETTSDTVMVSMLPSVCAKKSSERSDFDKKMIEFVEESMIKLAQELPVKLEELIPGVLERAAAVESAKTAAAEATTEERRLFSEADSAKVKLSEAGIALMQTTATEAEREPAILAAKAAQASADVVLQEFAHSTLGAFEFLREQVRQPPSNDGTDVGQGIQASPCTKSETQDATTPREISAGGA